MEFKTKTHLILAFVYLTVCPRSVKVSRSITIIQWHKTFVSGQMLLVRDISTIFEGNNFSKEVKKRESKNPRSDVLTTHAAQWADCIYTHCACFTIGQHTRSNRCRWSKLPHFWSIIWFITKDKATASLRLSLIYTDLLPVNQIHL